MTDFAIITLFIFLILTISIAWTQPRGAPWVPTSMRVVHKMLIMAQVGPDDVVYDLGCGDGRMIITAARHYGARAVGIELDPLRYLWCKLWIMILGVQDRVRIIHGDFYSQDLHDADVITCFLLPSTNKKLEGKFKQDLRPNTRVVSKYFTFPNLPLVYKDDRDTLYLYKV